MLRQLKIKRKTLVLSLLVIVGMVLTSCGSKEEKPPLSSYYPDEILEQSDLDINLKIASKYFIEEYEKQKVKTPDEISIAIYSNEIISDKAGTEFPYSFLVSGRYEEKGSGALRDFIMTLGFKDSKSLDDGQASCLQYISEDDNNSINTINPDDDVLSKLL